MIIEFNKQELEAMIRIYAEDRIVDKFRLNNKYITKVTVSKDKAVVQILSEKKED